MKVANHQQIHPLRQISSIDEPPLAAEDRKFLSTLENNILLEELQQRSCRPWIADAVGKLRLIEHFVRLLETTDHTQILPTPKEQRVINQNQSRARRSFISQTRSLLDKRVFNINGIEHLTQNFILSERAYLFIETYRDHAKDIINMGLDEIFSTTCQQDYALCIGVLNKFITDLRRRSQASGFRQKVAHRKEKSSRQLKSMHALIDDLLRQHARLLVIRIDLAYEKPQSATASSSLDNSTKELDAILKHRARLINNMRSKPSIFANCLGHILKLEQGVHGGFHLHAVFFFNGAQVISDYYYGEKIGKYWKSVVASTDNQMVGRYYNCSAAALEYKKLGIGFVNYFDHQKIGTIKNDVLGYFAKESMYLLPKLMKNTKTLTRSTISQQRCERTAKGPKRSKTHDNGDCHASPLA